MLRVLKRDIMRLLRVPTALVVIGALLVLPSLYTWYNVRAFWNPYESTGHLKICVVNEDTGASSSITGDINVGQMVVDELHDNHEMDWQFVDYDEAMRQVDAGVSYAAFVIPADFSKNLLTITTGDYKKSSVEYYVNEKVGPIAPKITDTGANTLDEKINAAFVETVSLKAAEALDLAIAESDERLQTAKSAAATRVDEARARLEGASEAVGSLANRAEQAKQRAETAKSSLVTARQAIDAASDAMNSVSAAASTLQGDYAKFAAVAVPDAIAAMRNAADVYAEAARAVASLPAQGEQAQTFLNDLRASADVAQSQANAFSHVLADDVAPAVGADLGDLAGAAATAAGSLAGQKLVIAQAQIVLDDMVATLDSTASSLVQTRSFLDSLVDQVDRVQTDVMLLAGSQLIADLIHEDGVNAQKVSEFISAPTQIETIDLYPVANYGTAMAPLFMNLTFWVGAVMLMIVLRQEVDATGIKNLTLAQRYVGRYLLLAIICTLQAIICCAGLPVIGVEVTSMPALLFAAVIAALSYLSLIYMLSVLLQHIGKGICFILVFVQIPAATGLYPIEMTPEFFQVVYPLFPFTYGIGAMREAICGFYGLHYLSYLATLAGYFVATMAIGILLRPLMSNVNRMVARQIKAAGIYNGEDVEVPARRFRFSQMLRALTDRDSYRRILARRYERFQHMYPWLIKGCVIVGIVVPVAITLVFSLTMGDKAILLSVWLLWLVAIIIFLIVVETLRSGFARQLRLDSMSEGELRDLYLTRDATEAADKVHLPKCPHVAAESNEDGEGRGGDADA